MELECVAVEGGAHHLRDVQYLWNLELLCKLFAVDDELPK
jgi:hypothetical protein